MFGFGKKVNMNVDAVLPSKHNSKTDADIELEKAQAALVDVFTEAMIDGRLEILPEKLHVVPYHSYSERAYSLREFTMKLRRDFPETSISIHSKDKAFIMSFSVYSSDTVLKSSVDAFLQAEKDSKSKGTAAEIRATIATIKGNRQ